ncbi:MAG: hypothetical protein ASARMPRED_003247 [Alectoria sarmentosa]|nr:MAG: hypothetical protein ASARMPRED_003247 [Alectoria sarmentosa]
MQLPTQLPFGILCILFTHLARVSAVCSTLPCDENVPVYGVDNPPLYSGTITSAQVGETPVVSTTSPAAVVNPPVTTAAQQSSTPPAAVPPTSSISTPVFPPTTASSASPISTPSIILSAVPTVIYNPLSSVGVPTVTPPSLTIASSDATPSVIQSTPASLVSSRAFNSSASATVPASITQCGNCRVLADQVQVYYWPTASVKNDCARGASVSPFQTGVPYASNASRIQALAPQVAESPITTVVDGHTFNFPSLYVSVIGGISVSDSCSLKGSVHTNPEPVAVQAITTASYASWPSTCRPQGQNAEAVIDILALSDIACPTWGLSNQFTTSCDGSTYLTATYGEPYNPVILVPTELMSIDPAWGACTTNTADALLTLPCGIYDPPKALQTASALVPGGDSGAPFTEAIPEDRTPGTLDRAGTLVPSVTPVNDSPAPTTPTAAPANIGSPSLPESTKASSSAGNDADLLKLDPLDPGTKESDDPSQSSSDQQGDSAPGSDPQKSDSSSPTTTPSDDPAKSNPNSSDSNISDDPSQNGSGQKEASAPASESQNSDPNAQLAVPQAPTTISLGGGAPSTQGVGAFINGALGGGSVPAPSPAFTPHAVTALGQTFSITDPSAVAIAGSTLSVGGPAHTSDGKYYSLAPSGNLIAGTIAPNPDPSSPPVLSVAGATYTANSASEFVVAGQTLTPGGQITVASTTISLRPSADVAVVGGSTQLLTTPAPSPDPAVMTFAGSTYTANAASQFIIAGQTLTPGGQIIVSSTPLSLAPSANVAVIGTSTQTLTTAAPASNPARLIFAGTIYTANTASQFVIAGQTLTPGGTITASGTPIGLPEGTNFAVIGSSTQFLAAASAPPTAEAPVMTWDGSTYTADASSDFVIASETLTPGGIITVLGTPMSLAQGAADVVIGSSTQTLSSAIITPADVVTVAGQVVTAHPSGFAIAGTTVLPGGTGVTVAGTPVSLGLGGTLVVGNRTTVLPTQEPSTGPEIFEGGQGKLVSPRMVWLVAYTACCTVLGAFVLAR